MEGLLVVSLTEAHKVTLSDAQTEWTAVRAAPPPCRRCPPVEDPRNLIELDLFLKWHGEWVKHWFGAGSGIKKFKTQVGLVCGPYKKNLTFLSTGQQTERSHSSVVFPCPSCSL